MVLSSRLQPLWEINGFTGWMQAQCQVDANPSNQADEIGPWVQLRYMLLFSTSTIAICYYYSAQNLTLTGPPNGRQMLTWPTHCSMGPQPVPMLYITVAVVINVTARDGILKSLTLESHMPPTPRDRDGLPRPSRSTCAAVDGCGAACVGADVATGAGAWATLLAGDFNDNCTTTTH